MTAPSTLQCGCDRLLSKTIHGFEPSGTLQTAHIMSRRRCCIFEVGFWSRWLPVTNASCYSSSCSVAWGRGMLARTGWDGATDLHAGVVMDTQRHILVHTCSWLFTCAFVDEKVLPLSLMLMPLARVQCRGCDFLAAQPYYTLHPAFEL